MNDKRDLEPYPHFFRGLFSTLALMALLLAAGAFVVAFAAALSGCASAPELPEGALEFVTNYLDRISQEKPTSDAGADSDAEPSEGPAMSPAPGAVAPPIAWKCGGFDGSKAREDPATQIRGLRISGDGLSYRWAAGDLSNWGLSRTDAGALACAFWWDGSRWVGGKFDWISTSRLTRDFKNIRDRYHGWDPDAFLNAKRRAFCIVSADGRKRTNLLEETR